MEKKLQRLNLMVGLVLFLFDYGSDIYVAIQYWNNGEIWWFSLTVVFISVPSIIVNITAIIQVINAWRCIAALLQLSIVIRYFEVISSPIVDGTYSLARLRYLETITESAPQWCLQVYIMLRQWSFPSYTIVSSVLSFLSLIWSIRTLEKERVGAFEDDFGFCEAFVLVIWQMFTLVSRLSAIVIISYVFRYAVFFLAGHWLLMVIYHVFFQRMGEDFLGLLFLSLLATYPSLFHSISLNDILSCKSPKAEMIVAYIFIVVENIVIVVLSLTIDIPDAKHMDVLKPIAYGCLIGGTSISFIFFCCFIYITNTSWINSFSTH
ncbi:XK-related protein 6-like [Dendronephthya gigantea]|uniref:XK-related protein 6-like n=1 Tax=Dendronephthya gigantea TaxID=151771 RepID=UPI00106BD8A6|nr:XK-related protein 6-like [Dendronephthya gigantea]